MNRCFAWTATVVMGACLVDSVVFGGVVGEAGAFGVPRIHIRIWTPLSSRRNSPVRSSTMTFSMADGTLRGEWQVDCIRISGLLSGTLWFRAMMEFARGVPTGWTASRGPGHVSTFPRAGLTGTPSTPTSSQLAE